MPHPRSKYPSLFSDVPLDAPAPDTSLIKGKYPLLFGSTPAASPQSEGMIEGLVKDVTSVPQSFLGRMQSSLQSGITPGMAGFGLIPPSTQEGLDTEKRALATTAGTAAADLTAGLVNPALGGLASRTIGKVLSRSAIGAAGVGTYSGIKEGKPAEGALTGAIGANVLAAIPGGARMLKNGVVKSVGKVLDADPLFKAKVEQGLDRVVVDWHRAFTTGEQRLARWVPATGQLMTKARMVGSLVGGNLTAQYAKAVKGLNSYEQAVMGGIIEGKLKPTVQGLSGLVREGNEDQVIRAAAETENMLKTIGSQLKELSIPVSDGEDGLHKFELLNDYIPHRIVNTLQYVTPGPIQDEAIRKVLQANISGREVAANLANEAEVRRRVAGYAIRRAKRQEVLPGTLPKGIPQIESMIRRGSSPEEIDKVINLQTKEAAKRSLKENRAELFSAKKLAKTAKELAAKNRITTKDEALSWLENMHKQASGLAPRISPYAGGSMRSPHLTARMIGLPGYEMDPSLVLPAYFEHIGRRIAFASEFGPQEIMPEFSPEQIMSMTPKTLSARQQYPRAFKEVDALQEGPTKLAAEKAISDYLGKAREVPWYQHYANPIATSQVVTKLARGAIMQPSQMLTAIVRTQLRGSFTNLIKTMSNDPEALDFATRSGVTLRGAVRQAEETLSGGGTVAEKFLNSVGFTQMDMKSRIFGALQGATFAENQASKLARLESRVRLGDAGAKTQFDRISERLTKIGINPNEVLSQGGQLTDEQLRVAGSTVSHDANFWGDTLSLPEAFASPGGRFLLQFKSFAAQQFVFAKNHISKPAIEYVRSGGKKGDILPLIRAATILPAGGEIINDIRSLITNKHRQNMGTVEHYFDNLAAVSAFGLVGDAMNATKYGIEGLSSFVVGPAVSTSIKGVYAASQLAQGKPNLAKKFVAREILPLAGPVPALVAPAIESATVPSKKRPPLVGASTEQP